MTQACPGQHFAPFGGVQPQCIDCLRRNYPGPLMEPPKDTPCPQRKTMLTNNETRCIGATVGNTYKLRLECITCQRRTAPRAEAVVMKEPPAQHPCPIRIAPEVGE